MKSKLYWIIPENNDHITAHLYIDYDKKLIYVQYLDMNNFFNWKDPIKYDKFGTELEMDTKASELINEIKFEQLNKSQSGTGEVL